MGAYNIGAAAETVRHMPSKCTSEEKCGVNGTETVDESGNMGWHPDGMQMPMSAS